MGMKYKLTFTAGSSTGVVPVTITRLTDNQQVSFIPAPAHIIDISQLTPSSPTSQCILYIFRNGYLIWVSSVVTEYSPTLPSKKPVDLVITGQPNDQITFSANVLVASSATGGDAYTVIIEVE